MSVAENLKFNSLLCNEPLGSCMMLGDNLTAKLRSSGVQIIKERDQSKFF